jgi:hypothetical protein
MISLIGKADFLQQAAVGRLKYREIAALSSNTGRRFVRKRNPKYGKILAQIPDLPTLHEGIPS